MAYCADEEADVLDITEGVADVDGVTVTAIERVALLLSDELIDPPVVAVAKMLAVASDDRDIPLNAVPETEDEDE